MELHTTPALETATFGGGCFWCIEPVFQELKGVEHVESGYMGGHTLQPTYREICQGDTGHAEVIQLSFDPFKIAFSTLADIFFAVHDPTTLNRQGNDRGTQYRSVIFWHHPTQHLEAEAAKVRAAALWDKPIVTEVTPATTFYKAEGYHQNYFKDNPWQPYCIAVIAPKVKKFRESFKSLLR